MEIPKHTKLNLKRLCKRLQRKRKEKVGGENIFFFGLAILSATTSKEEL